METIEKIKWLNRGIALGKMCQMAKEGRRQKSASLLLIMK